MCRATVHIDQSRCNANLQHIRLAVEQEISINANSHHFRDVITLIDKVEAGVPANTSEVTTRHLELALSQIRYTIPNQRKKKGVMKAYSPEDLYLA